MIKQESIAVFQQKVWLFYTKNKRSFAWRLSVSPYTVVVSEIMLQQTQTGRVITKFDEWLNVFPDFETLAQATVSDVLCAWQGLGYNRRGLALHAFAKRIIAEFGGVVPQDLDVLQSFKGIGPNTAGSICAFAFNKPVTFIETNIRTVFIYEFFKDQQIVSDKDLLPFIIASLDQQNPREWYYALMDYGVYLKKELKVSNKRSKHYTKQSKFIGSQRQIRGAIIRVLTQTGVFSYEELQKRLLLEYPENQWDVSAIVKKLVRDGFLEEIEQSNDLLVRLKV